MSVYSLPRGESSESERTAIEIRSIYLRFQNFKLLVKQTSIRLVYLSVIKVTVLNSLFPLLWVGVREEHFFWLPSVWHYNIQIV